MSLGKEVRPDDWAVSDRASVTGKPSKENPTEPRARVFDLDHCGVREILQPDIEVSVMDLKVSFSATSMSAHVLLLRVVWGPFPSRHLYCRPKVSTGQG